MNRPALTWALFAAALAIVLAAMGWISLTVLRLDEAQAAAQRQAALEENVRLALWRMDSSLAPLIAQENARPYFVYNAFYPAERAYTRMFNDLGYGEVLIPSPLMTFSSEQVVVHFQIGPDGRLTSPQAPEGQMRELAEERYLTGDTITSAAARLAALAPAVTPAAMAAALPPGAVLDLNSLVALKQPAPEPRQAQNALPLSSSMQQSANNDYENSSRIVGNAVAYNIKGGQRLMPQKEAPEKAPRVVEGVMRPIRSGETLVLARRVRVNGGDYLQGCQLNWPNIRRGLLNDIRDLLPHAALELTSPTVADPSRDLATLPARLIPGALAIEPAQYRSPVRASLAVAWACVLVAAAAVAGLLGGALALSERRAAFVSAVTHEMRTPLTTFRLYTEMLGEGRVKEEAAKRDYIRTLQDEAERLTHMVENVLAHARLERGATRSPVETVTLGTVLERVTDRLRRRAARAGMELVVQVRDEAMDALVWADVVSLEQILSNLVDNSCKYAAAAEDKRIHLEADVFAGHPLLRVRDHGPGISQSRAKRLFRPFDKPAREAAETAPGVGLGLALSRRLARAMGGELRFEPQNVGGAAFLLALEAAAKRGAR